MFDRALNAPLVVPVQKTNNNELLNKHAQKTLYSRQKLPPPEIIRIIIKFQDNQWIGDVISTISR